MKHYETLVLLRTDSTEEKIKLLEKTISNAVENSSGIIVTFDKWGKYKLAYPIENQSYGIYILSRYDLPEDKIQTFFKDFNTNIQVKFSDFVMRHVNVILKPGRTGVEYKKPSAIDESESASSDRRIMSMSGQNISHEDDDFLEDSRSDGEVLDISRLSLDPDHEES